MSEYCFIEMLLFRIAWSSTYTYILLFFIAAAFLAFIGRPRDRGEAVKRLYAGSLLRADEIGESVDKPCVKVRCVGGGKVVFERLGLAGMTASGAVSLAVTFKGKDVEILERDSAGFEADATVTGARFEVDMTGYEWRHVKWIDEDSGRWCAFTLHVREGISFSVELKQ